MSNYLREITSLKRLVRYEKKYGMHKLRLQSAPVVGDVLRQGYCLVPDFWSQQRCAEARGCIDELLDNPTTNIWRDDFGADERILGADRLNKALDIFNDESINRIISSLYDEPNLYGFTMAARLRYVPGNLGSGQGWHRDAAVTHQYKAILYLSDTGPDNGPFQYLRGSGNILPIYRLAAEHGISIDASRLEDKESEILAAHNQPIEVCAPAGTLLIANTRGIHRGKPLLTGERYALTNYYWKQGIPQNIYPLLNGED